ncbi:MAG: hypothetical protein AAF297_04970 [Planctomycetota bacterium]
MASKLCGLASGFGLCAGWGVPSTLVERASGQVPLRAVVVSGDTLQGDRPVEVTEFFSLVGVNARDEVLIEQTRDVLIAERGRLVDVLYGFRDEIRFRNRPGTSEFFSFRFSQQNDSGGFGGRAIATGTIIFFDPRDGSRPWHVVREGADVPGVPGRDFDGLWPFRTPVHTATIGRSVAEGAVMGFTGTYTGGRGIFRWSSGDTVKVAATDDAVPGMPAGVVFGANMPYEVSMNARGEMAFIAPLEVPRDDGTSAFDLVPGVFRYSPFTGLTLIAVEGMQVPGEPDGVVFGELEIRGYVGIGDGGEVAFGTGGNFPDVLYVDRGGPVSSVTRIGDAVPGVPGATFSSFGNGRFRVLPDGSTSFDASIAEDGVSRRAIVTIAPMGAGGVLIAAGDAAPGFPVGHVVTGAGYRNPEVTASGRFLFSAGVDTGAESFLAVYAYDPVLGVRLVLHEGQVIDADTSSDGPGDPRPIVDLPSLDTEFIGDSGWVAVEVVLGGVTETRAVVAADPFRCAAADFAEPFGQIDLSDVDAFITLFLTGRGDLVRPFGVSDMDDVDAFIASVISGCP